MDGTLYLYTCSNCLSLINVQNEFIEFTGFINSFKVEKLECYRCVYIEQHVDLNVIY